MTLRIAFFGTPEVAVRPLEALHAADSIDVVAVVTNPDRPRGRHKAPQPPAVKTAATALGITVLQPDRAVDALGSLADAQLDAIAVVAYGSILPKTVLALPRLGCVNLHFSLLPRWRGAAPVQHAIRAGDTQSGLTTFVLDEGMDTGPIIDQIAVPIATDATAGDLLDELSVTGGPFLRDSLLALAEGHPTHKQDDAKATYAPKITAADTAIDWDVPAVDIVNLIRSANPTPGAHTTLRGRRLKVWSSQLHPRPTTPATKAGRIASIASDEVVVSSGDGHIALLEVQPEGRARMPAVDFARGRDLQVGEQLGSST